MPTKGLTELFVERVKPPSRGREEYFDAVSGGLALRVTEKGHKSWSLFYRAGGRLRRYTIGSYPDVKLVQARRHASEALERVRAGADLTQEKRARRDAGSMAADSFAHLVCDYLERHGRKNLAPRTYKETKRVLESEDLAAWRHRPASSITRRDVIEVIDHIEQRAAVQANRTLARLKALFSWAVQKDRIQTSPGAGIRPPTKEVARERTLDDDELRWLWTACDEIDWPFGPVVKLLILTAQRRDEVTTMTWAELDLAKGIWAIPAEKAKNSREHIVHLSEPALAVIRALPRLGEGDGQHGLVFTTTGVTPVSGFSRAKNQLDTAMLRAKHAALCRGRGKQSLSRPDEIIPHWSLHDLRRTATTGMVRLNVPPHVVDKILNHVSGTIRGVAAIYNKFKYLEERRGALQAWGHHVENLTTPSNLIVLSRGSGKR
jgi:integrase